MVITPPDFKHADSNVPVSELPQIVLQCDDTQQCSTSNNTFDLNGNYQLTFYVLDNKDQMAIPKTTTLTQTQGIPGATDACLDADGNGNSDALTDGLLSIRYLFGIRGESLMQDAKANNCTYCTASEIEAILDQCVVSGRSDIDGNGMVDALTDGLLMIRYLFGIRGESLIKNAVGDGCSRCTEFEIEPYIQGLML